MAFRAHTVICASLLAASAMLPLRGAHATTTNASIGISASVLSFCTVSALPLAFGNYSSTAASAANTTIGVICTSGTSYTLGLDAGTGTGATTANRLMTGVLNPSATLAYQLYSDSGLASLWGNTVGTNTVAGTGNGLLQNLTVYGKVPSGQNVAAGAYQDTVTVTLTY
jgi:spore coat protein U-like protein